MSASEFQPSAQTAAFLQGFATSAAGWQRYLTESPSITDLEQRDDFKTCRRGIRHAPDDSLTIELDDCEEFDALPVMLQRSSARQFSHSPIARDAIGRLLSCLRSRAHEKGWKYRYASAGGLYPVQLYLAAHAPPHLGPPAIAPGTYYYNPVEHSLKTLSPGAELHVSMHLPINRPVFRDAAFSIFLVSEQDAIAPMYGGEGLRFALLEAGMMAQVLDEAAPRCGLGLCHVGAVDFDPYRVLFHLSDSHVLLHSYLGGGLCEAQRLGAGVAGRERAIGLSFT